MSLRKKWARTTTLILFVVAMIAYPVVVCNEIKVSIRVGALFVIQSVLAIYIPVLLYSKECTAWFTACRQPQSFCNRFSDFAKRVIEVADFKIHVAKWQTGKGVLRNTLQI